MYKIIIRVLNFNRKFGVFGNSTAQSPIDFKKKFTVKGRTSKLEQELSNQIAH